VVRGCVNAVGGAHHEWQLSLGARHSERCDSLGTIPNWSPPFTGSRYRGRRHDVDPVRVLLPPATLIRLRPGPAALLPSQGTSSKTASGGALQALTWLTAVILKQIDEVL
jgi:hypothetical protein